jgi:iron(III) transport system permease protein
VEEVVSGELRPLSEIDAPLRRSPAGRLLPSRLRFGHQAFSVAVGFAFVLLIALPLGLVLVQAFMPALFDPKAGPGSVSLAALAHSFSDLRSVAAILHSMLLGCIAAASATALGFTYALVMQRTDVPCRRLLAFAPWLVFLTPGYLKALAWVLLMAPRGYLAQLGLVPSMLQHAFFGVPGLVFVHTLNLFPLAYFIVASAMAGLGGEFEDAARVAGASPWRAWLRINLPLLASAVALAYLAIFAEVVADFGMAATIARTVNFGLLTYSIFTATMDFPVDFALAGSLSLVLLCMLGAVLVGDHLLRRQRSLRLISGRSRPARRMRLGAARWPVAAGVLLVGILAVYLPLVAIALRAACRTLGQGLVAGNLTWRFLLQAITPDHAANTALLRSLGFAVLTALLAGLIAFLLAWRIEQASKLLRKSVVLVAVGTIAIPGIVLGLGYVLVWDRLPGFRDLPLYGTWPLLVLGYAAAGLPYALVIVLAAISQISPNLVDAARLHGARGVARLTRIVMPLIALSLVTAVLFVFVRTVFELPMSEVLQPADGPPAPTLIVRLFGNDDDGIGSALSLVAVLATGLSAGALWLVAARLMRSFGGMGLHAMVGMPRAR